MRILVLGQEARYRAYCPPWVRLEQQDLTFLDKESTEEQIAAAGKTAEILFADAITPVTASLIAQLPQLRLIQSEGVAFDRIDLAAAGARGIYVCNNKGCNAASVAEHTIMLMLMALRHGVTGHNAVRAGRQIAMKEAVMASDAPELGLCTVGLVGFGDIAQATARRLAPFGCPLCYYAPHRRSQEVERDFGVAYLPLEELAARCDILSLHCAVTPATCGMVNDDLLSKMKPTAILVNTARGDLLDNQAVRRALIEGRLGGIAADTLAPEPTPADHPLVDLPPEVRDRAVYSPHLGGITGGSFRRAHANMWNSLRLVLEGKRPNFIVNGL